MPPMQFVRVHTLARYYIMYAGEKREIKIENFNFDVFLTEFFRFFDDFDGFFPFLKCKSLGKT